MTTSELVKQCREALEQSRYYFQTRAQMEDNAEVCRAALRAIDEWEAEAEDSAMGAHSLANTAVDAADLAAACQALAESRLEILNRVFAANVRRESLERAVHNAALDLLAEPELPADALAARDERMKALGAAEALDQAHKDICQYAVQHEHGTGETWTWSDAATYCFEKAAALRQKAGE